MHKLILKPSAELDATDAANWYNQKRDGLGNEFLLALEAKINAIRRNPKQFIIIYKNIRRTFTERFPYGVFFIIEDDVVYVLAIIHTSRSPKSGRKENNSSNKIIPIPQDFINLTATYEIDCLAHPDMLNVCSRW